MPLNFLIRQYQAADCATLSNLFYETVHTVNAKDYTNEQLFVWASDIHRLQRRQNDLSTQKTLIAEANGEIVGFGSIDNSGYLDLLFTHKDFQGQGIATALCDRLEKGFCVLTTYASVTAKPFFEHRGYTIVKEREVERCGVKLKNFEMIKRTL